MIRHVVLLRWADGTTAAQVQAARDALAALPAHIPQIRAYHAQPDAGLADGNHDFVIVADFDDADGWRAYQQHPEHQRVITELIRPIVASRSAGQVEWTA